MRPTGKLHLGNYMGALANWVKLQQDYECYFFIADWHALTTDYADPSQIRSNIYDVALDYLAAGLDPHRSVLFVQSHVPQHAELHLLLSMITSVGWLERVPSYKEQQENLKGKDLTTYGFLGYPLLQSADILIYRPQLVPVGQDQEAHVELTREVARRFNSIYKTNLFPEPGAKLTPSPKLPGIDGRKMSKSYGNTIGLTDSKALVSEKLERMSNGGQRNLLTDPGNPALCPVFDLHKLFSSEGVKAEINENCRIAMISCIECKQLAAESISSHLEPIQGRRRVYEANPSLVEDVLRDGAEKARAIAEATMEKVRIAMGLSAKPNEDGHAVIEQKGPWFDVAFRINSLNENGSRRTWKECASLFRGDWLHRILPRDIVLKEPKEEFENADREWEQPLITTSGKRVLLTVSNGGPQVSQVEQRPDMRIWDFSLPQRTYEVWVLLVYQGDAIPLVSSNGCGEISVFVIPQKEISQPFAQARKLIKKDEKVRVTVMKDGQFYLRIAEGPNKRIDVFQNNYEPLR